jgi:hypothetical protein
VGYDAMRVVGFWECSYAMAGSRASKHARAGTAHGVDGHGRLLGSERVDYAMSLAHDHRSERVDRRGRGSYIRVSADVLRYAVPACWLA